MRAIVDGKTIAESSDVLEVGGYAYFPMDAVRLEWLRKTPKTADDLDCPHGVQFYDVVVNGRVLERAAWNYEAPQPKMAQVKDRFGFWEDVEVV